MKVRRAFYLLVVFWCLAAKPFPAAADSQTISDAEALTRFAAAGAAYRAEDYGKAAAAYAEILKGGKESGALYYNLGNGYFKKGDLGRAILNYERARRLIPRDGDLNFNLRYARQKAGLAEVAGQIPAGPWARLVERRIRNWTDRELVWLLCWSGLLGAVAHLFALHGRWALPLRRRTVGLLTVGWLLCLAGFFTKSAAEKDLAVAVAAAEAKFEPREDATTHFPAGEGTLLKILETEDGWAKVRRSDGKMGWVIRKNIERLEE